MLNCYRRVVDIHLHVLPTVHNQCAGIVVGGSGWHCVLGGRILPQRVQGHHFIDSVAADVVSSGGGNGVCSLACVVQPVSNFTGLGAAAARSAVVVRLSIASSLLPT